MFQELENFQKRICDEFCLTSSTYWWKHKQDPAKRKNRYVAAYVVPYFVEF